MWLRRSQATRNVAATATADAGADSTADAEQARDGGGADAKSPFEQAGCWARTSYSYVLPLLRQGYRQPIQPQDLPPLAARDKASAVADNIQTHWDTRSRAEPDTQW